MIAQHDLLAVRMQVHLLAYELGHRMPVQVMLGQHQRHDQRHQSLPVVLHEAQEPLLLSSLDRWFFR
jgi:hypothetical protein